MLQGGDESLQTLFKTFKCLPLAERGLRMGQPVAGCIVPAAHYRTNRPVYLLKDEDIALRRL